MLFTSILFSIFACQNQVPRNDLAKESVSKNENDVHAKRLKQFPQHYIMNDPYRRKIVALTFDDGPSMHSLAIAETLNKHKIPATFFMLGNAMEQYPHIVNTLYSQGHEIANHSYDHTNIAQYDDDQQLWQQQVAAQMHISKTIIGKSSRFFRPPFGSITDKQIRFLAEQNIKTIMWSIDTSDWNDDTNSVKNITQTATTQAHPGAIILMHDGGGDRENTATALEGTIAYYRHHGYQFVTVSQLLNSPAYF